MRNIYIPFFLADTDIYVHVQFISSLPDMVGFGDGSNGDAGGDANISPWNGDIAVGHIEYGVVMMVVVQYISPCHGVYSGDHSADEGVVTVVVVVVIVMFVMVIVMLVVVVMVAVVNLKVVSPLVCVLCVICFIMHSIRGVVFYVVGGLLIFTTLLSKKKAK